MAKVEAVQQIIREYTGTEIKIKKEKVDRQRVSGVVFLMVDSMEARKTIWENCIKLKAHVKLLVEPRMGLDMIRLHNVNPIETTHIKQYEDTYYTDEEAEVSACGTSLTVITTALATASYCARQLINFHGGEVQLDNEVLLDLKYNNLLTNQWKH